MKRGAITRRHGWQTLSSRRECEVARRRRTRELGGGRRRRRTRAPPRGTPIKKRLKEALEQHKEDASEDDTDAARLAAIRDSEDRAKQKFADIEKKIEELKALLEEQE